MKMLNPKIAIVIPAYNEEEVLQLTIDKMSELMKDYVERNVFSQESYVLFVDDGSADKTWNIIKKAHEKYNFIKGVKFSRNFGNQSAILAGYLSAKNIGCDAVITIDADLQQDITKIEEFVNAYKDGYDVVCGVRNSYTKKISIKSLTSSAFYKCMNFLNVPLKPNHSEYRLLSKKALDILNQYNETNIFIRGMVYTLGLKTKYINYNISKRALGTSKFNLYSLSKMALNGMVSFSTRPLDIVFFIGAVISFLSLVFAFLFILGNIFDFKIITNDIGPFRIWQIFVAGLQIFCIGVVGEYIGQILLEVKGRPRYIVDEEIF